MRTQAEKAVRKEATQLKMIREKTDQVESLTKDMKKLDVWFPFFILCDNEHCFNHSVGKQNVRRLHQKGPGEL